MSAPPGYRPLDLAGARAYVRERPDLLALVGGDPAHVREVGDGNLNLVFVVRADPARPGVVLKQSLPWVRVHGEGWPLTIERARHEADAYEAHRAFAEDAIPRYHGFDPEMYVVAMEDLADLRVWRGALVDGEIHPGAGATMGRYVARIAFWTSDFGMEPEARKRHAAATVNPELCRITEDLVLTEPYLEHEHNWHHPPLDPLVREIRADERVRLEVATLKHRFLTRHEALIHGDLHTGSVMVGGGRAVAIDPEFAFHGPVGFDLGALFANYVIAAARADRIGRDAAFRAHVAAQLRETWEAFTAELRRLWPERVDRFFPDDLLDRYLAAVWDDALGFAAAKATRRMIGYAHVSDIETLEEPARSSAASAVLRIARRLLLERAALPDPAATWGVVTEELARRTALDWREQARRTALDRGPASAIAGGPWGRQGPRGPAVDAVWTAPGRAGMDRAWRALPAPRSTVGSSSGPRASTVEGNSSTAPAGTGDRVVTLAVVAPRAWAGTDGHRDVPGFHVMTVMTE